MSILQQYLPLQRTGRKCRRCSWCPFGELSSPGQTSVPPSRHAPTRKNGTFRDLNFNVFNLRKQTAGCFREAEKDLRKIIRHLEKTTKHLEKTTKPAEKITKHLVTPSPGLFFGRKGQKETEEAPYLRKVLGLLMQIYNIFRRKANRQNCLLTFRPRRGIKRKPKSDGRVSRQRGRAAAARQSSPWP